MWRKRTFSGTGWHKNSNGYFSINNGKAPEECLWIDDSITILNNYNYQFKRVKKEEKVEEIKEEKIVEEVEPLFICPKSDLYGIYLKAGQKVYLK